MERITPRATYRLMLRPGFGFDDAARLAPYLQKLGISHLYFSPYLQAAEGSTHGYDVVDHRSVNEELGGAEAHARMCATLGEHELGQVIDVVPNHMSIASRKNLAWWDVLENGPASPYAPYFDVDWEAPNERQINKVLMPILGDHYGRVLEAKGIELGREGGSFYVRASSRELPLSPESLAVVLRQALEAIDHRELAFYADALVALPPSNDLDPESLRRRRGNMIVLKRLLAQLIEESDPVRTAIDGSIDELNADIDALDGVLELQNYRLAFWRSARHDLDYRRFFDINELAGLRVGDRRVFEGTHELILDWCRRGVVDGLRIDHPDGLRAPERYFEWLREATERAWIVVEKILEPDEGLPDSWPVDGTTGYDFMFRAGALFVDGASEAQMTRLYRDFTGDETEDFHDLILETKLLVLEQLLGADLNRLARTFMALCEVRRRHRDFTRMDLREALREVIARFPVYRTYLRRDATTSSRDRRYVEHAIEHVRKDRPDIDGELLDFLSKVLNGDIQEEAAWQLASRFQQLTGPAMAKGVEDTAFYRYNRLISLNEVGGTPARFGLSVSEFHAFCLYTQRSWPRTMLSTSTHDTKRSEDVRMRIALLSQMPTRWESAMRRWSELAEEYRTGDLPDRGVEYLMWQTLVGAWPIEPDRLLGYLTKAVKEAKVHTSWTRPNEAYEAALQRFAEGVLADETIREELGRFIEELDPSAQRASIAHALLKLTVPGVPDIYQGQELWDYSLADPDNRRPVDFDRRIKLLDELDGLGAEEILARSDEGLPKLHVTRAALQLRARRPASFGASSHYKPLDVDGPGARGILAFAREKDVVTIAPTLFVGQRWEDTTVLLPSGHWRHCLVPNVVVTGRVSLRKLLEAFPVALLEKEDEG